MDRSSVLISAGANDNTHEQTGDGLVELKSNSKVHNPFRLYDNFRKGCTNVLTAPRGLKGSNGFRNNGGHPNNHHSQCYEVADAQSSLASTSIQITSIKSRRLNSEADSSDSSNSADDTTTQVIKVKCSPKHRLSDSSTCSSSNEDTRYPQPIGDFSKEIFNSLDSTLGRDDSLPLCVSSSEQVKKASDSEDPNDRNKTEKRVHINDGNTTDDSGVDSLCCILENDKKISDGLNKLNEGESNSQYLTQDHKTVNTLSASSLHDNSTSKSATSFLQDIATYGYDTISKKRNSIWKREYNISGPGANGSDNYVTSVDEEDLINEHVDTKDHHTYANIHFKGNSYSLVPEDDKRSNVELTSVVQNKSLISTLSNNPRKASKTVKQETEVKLNRKGEPKSVKDGSAPIYSSVNVAAKKASKKKGKDSSVCKQISNAAFAKLPRIKFLAEDIDIGETSVANSDTHGNEFLVDHSNFNDLPRSTGPKEAEVTDLRELTKLLNNTSALLQRNSNLRASLTISVKNPRNGASNAKTFVLPSGRDGKDTAKNQTGTSPINIKNSDSNNDLRTVAATNQLDGNNVTVLVNQGYENNVPSDDFKYNEMPIDCEFKTSSGIPNQANTTIRPDVTKLTSDKDDAEDDQFISLVNIDAEADPSRPPAFVRHNPIRRPVVAAAMTTTNSNTSTVSVATKSVATAPTVCRRSIRLAPKTVANLANKFEACERLLASDGSSHVSQGKKIVPSDKGNSALPQKNDKTSKKSNSNIPEKELKLCKKDITKIIGTLNRLEEDAKRSCYRPRPMTTPGSISKKNSNSNGNVTNNDFCTKSGTQGKMVLIQ